MGMKGWRRVAHWQHDGNAQRRRRHLPVACRCCCSLLTNARHLQATLDPSGCPACPKSDEQGLAAGDEGRRSPSVLVLRHQQQSSSMDCPAPGLAEQAASNAQSLRWLLLGGLVATLIWTAALLSLRWSERRWQNLKVGWAATAAAASYLPPSAHRARPLTHSLPRLASRRRPRKWSGTRPGCGACSASRCRHG